MTITGIVLNEMPLIIPDTSSTTGFFKSFMNYCIQNFPVRDNDSIVIRKHFKPLQNHIEFKQAVHYNRIVEYNGLFFSTYSNKDWKKKIMEEIAGELGINLRILTRNNN